jgi:5-methyltetrahydrofolate--homocysteine methyltransferase
VDELRDFVKRGQSGEAEAAVRALLAGGADPEAILSGALIPAMDEVGQLFQDRVYFLPEMLVAAAAMKRSLAILRPRLVEAGVEPAGRAVIGTVEGDIHDIGKNLVGMALEGAGFEVVDLGHSVAPDRFVGAVEAHGPQVVCLSALLTTTMMAMSRTVEALERAGLRGGVGVIVGGAPLSPRFAQEIGADCYGPDAVAGRDLARRFVSG